LSKKGRNQRRLASVADAAQVLAMTDRLIVRAGAQTTARRDPVLTWIAGVASELRQQWNRTRVVLRTDTDFAGALLSSSTDVELVPDWLARMPFDSLAYAFMEPISVHDGDQLCRYHGFLVSGTRSRTAARSGRHGVWTTYHPFAQAEGVRFLWLFTTEGDETVQGQTVTAMLTGPFGKARTLSDLIAMQEMIARDEGRPWGEEFHVLVPLGIQLLLYLAAQEPDLDELVPGTYSRPQQLDRATVANLGWRVGAAMRTWRDRPPEPTDEAPEDVGNDATTENLDESPGRSVQMRGWRRTSAGHTGTASGLRRATIVARSSATEEAMPVLTGTTRCDGTHRRRSTPARAALLPPCGR
jgi:hypothetical protein